MSLTEKLVKFVARKRNASDSVTHVLTDDLLYGVTGGKTEKGSFG